MTKILLAGDRFVTPQVLSEAIKKFVPNVETSQLQGDFPLTPLSNIADVREAVGNEEELIEALQGCEVCFTHTMPFSERVFQSCPDLRLVTVCRGGPVNVNLEAATKAGVAVTFTPGRNATATAEHSVAMILAAARQIAQRHSELKADQWRGDYYLYDQVGPELRSATIGLIGYGAVGSRVAAIMSAFGAQVMVYDPYLPEGVELPEGVTRAAKVEELLRISNVISLHARAMPENEKMLGAREFALLPQGAILVNCARGSLVDYDALCDALDSGHLFAAALDVFPFEPLPPDHRILNTPRLTVTPHLAGASRQAAELAGEIGARDISAFLKGEKPKHLANPEVYEREGV